jgi:ubiquinone/menaquinone biosynthesis C-methylase UbiE
MSAAAFDRIARRYDELWTETPAGRAQRAQVWRHIDPLFQSGDRILDIGCGTGADAAHLLARGVGIHATDASPAMLAECEILLGRNPQWSGAVLRAEEIASLPGIYDGALSNFGALNCVADLQPVARALAAKVRRGGFAAICTIGRFCAWETLRYSARFQFRKAFRRIGGRAQASMGIPVYYPTVARLRHVFAPEFQLVRWVGVGLWPPAAIDRTLAHLPVLRAMADHRLLIFKRT